MCCCNATNPGKGCFVVGLYELSWHSEVCALGIHLYIWYDGQYLKTTVGLSQAAAPPYGLHGVVCCPQCLITACLGLQVVGIIAAWLGGLHATHDPSMSELRLYIWHVLSLLCHM